jgi:small subunit ribosomal protein S6
MRNYDIVVIYSPDLTEDDAARATEEVRTALTAAGGKIGKDEAWGRRKLAYTIRKRREGIYHYFQADSDAKTVAELERRLRLSDNVLRHLVVREDEEVRRARKSAARRAAKLAKRPPRPPAPPAAPTGEAEVNS